jgi:hypothetical protein
VTTRRIRKRERNQRNMWEPRLNARDARDQADAWYDLARTRIEWIPSKADQDAAYRQLAEFLKQFDRQVDAPQLAFRT